MKKNNDNTINMKTQGDKKSQMSWDSHIQPMMAAQKGTGHCAICGQDGGIWASSPSCPLQPQEIKDLVAFAKSGGQPSDKRYFFGGMKLMFVKQDTTDNVAQFIFAPQSTAERKVTDEEKGL
ncbi:hypothetical protein MAR_019730, partial [Mya arenaria]